MQEKRNSIANALELRLTGTNPSTWKVLMMRNTNYLPAFRLLTDATRAGFRAAFRRAHPPSVSAITVTTRSKNTRYRPGRRPEHG